MVGLGRRKGISSLLVEPYRQIKLGLLFIIINVGFSGAIIAVFGFYVWDIYQAVSSYFKLSGAQNLDVISKFHEPIYMGLTLVLLFVVLTVLISLKYTHQIYGPLVSIHRYLDQLLAGQAVDPLILRESDQLKDLAMKLNRVQKILVEQTSGRKED